MNNRNAIALNSGSFKLTFDLYRGQELEGNL